MNRWLIIVCFITLSLSSSLWAGSYISSSSDKPQTTERIYYFDKNWQNSPTAVIGGFYRKLLKTEDKGFLVQDFYQNSDHKQSDPIHLQNEADLVEGAPKSIQGQLVLWHDNGQKSMEAFYKNGEIQGLLTSWYENGNKEIEQYYVNDKENGPATYWDEQGQKKLTFNFKDGNFNLISVWKDNYKVSESHYLDGKREGLSTYWYKDGKTKAIENYHQNKLNGLYISFYPDGKKQSEFNYIDNTPTNIIFWYSNSQKAADLTSSQPKQFSCSIWDEQGSIVYQGDNTERCILTVRNIFDGDMVINY